MRRHFDKFNTQHNDYIYRPLIIHVLIKCVPSHTVEERLKYSCVENLKWNGHFKLYYKYFTKLIALLYVYKYELYSM